MQPVVQPVPLAGEHASWLLRLEQKLSETIWSKNIQPIAEKLAANVPLDIDDGLSLIHI